jgi:3-dehydroquinate synthase/2-deoxy-scyllo-inosose synthase
LEASEQAKSMEAALHLISQARKAGGGTHASLFVALGGGLIGNITGLAASLIVRGVKLIHIPTTLLAGTDSVLSCKQGVNGVALGENSLHPLLIKNLLGVFKAPEYVFIALSLWQTLPPDEIRAGLCELIKNVISISPHLYDEVYAFLNPEAVYTLSDFHRIFRWCFEAKQAVMRDDAHEKSTALILELGHTFGHALEALTGMKHGLAIGLGLLVAAHISVARGYLSAEEYQKIVRLLERNGAPTTLSRAVSIDALMERVNGDNKIGYLPRRAGYHVMVLLERFGRPVLQNGLPLSYIAEEELQAAIAALQEPEAEGLGGAPQAGYEVNDVNHATL